MGKARKQKTCEQSIKEAIKILRPINVYDTWGSMRKAISDALTVLRETETHPTTERRVPDAQEMRQMLAAMQAGEMTVSRGVELLDMWLAGNYTDDQLPSVAKSRTLDLDEMPWDRIEKLAGQVAALTQLYELSVDQYTERRAIDLSCVINWLENGCDVKEAIKELRIYQALNAAPAPTKGDSYAD